MGLGIAVDYLWTILLSSLFSVGLDPNFLSCSLKPTLYFSGYLPDVSLTSFCSLLKSLKSVPEDALPLLSGLAGYFVFLED